MQFMTIRAAAAEVGVPQNALRQLVKNGQAPGFFSGTRFLIDVGRLKDLLATCTSGKPFNPGTEVKTV